MEIKRNSTRGRPKKDYWELKSRIAKETAENKWKLGRWRPKKQRNIDDSINTQISNHHKDISVLEKKNEEIHEHLKIHKISNDNANVLQFEEKSEKFSKIALICSIVFCAFAICYYFIFSQQNHNNLKFSEMSNIGNSIGIKRDVTHMEIGYNNESWDFVEVERININNDEEWSVNNEELTVVKNIDNDDTTKTNEVDNSDVALIRLFYDKINNKEFSQLANISDRYLKNSDSYRTYFSSNWLNNFLNKVSGNKVFVWWFSELPSDKPEVKHYWYIVKYKLNNESNFRQENWEIAIVERNWERLIWSIMCVTTWCSRMPFFQK